MVYDDTTEILSIVLAVIVVVVVSSAVILSDEPTKYYKEATITELGTCASGDCVSKAGDDFVNTGFPVMVGQTVYQSDGYTYWYLTKPNGRVRRD